MRGADDAGPESEAVITVEAELAELVPAFLANRQRDLTAIQAALDGGDFRTVEVLGHQMSGSGGGYGFDRVTEIGRALEAAARAEDTAAVREAVHALDHYLGCVRIVYK